MSKPEHALLAALRRTELLLREVDDPGLGFAGAVGELTQAVAVDRVGLALGCGPPEDDDERAGAGHPRAVPTAGHPGPSRARFFRGDGRELTEVPSEAALEQLCAAVAARAPQAGPVAWPAADDGSGGDGVILPILRGSEPFGAITVVTRADLSPGSPTLDWLVVWADMVGAMVARRVRWQAARQREALRRFTVPLNSELDLRKTFPTAVAELREVLGFELAVLLVLDEERQSLRYFSGTVKPWDESWIEIPVGGTATGLAWSKGEPVVVGDTAAGEFIRDRELADRGVRSHVVQPLVKRGRIVGSFNLGHTQPDQFAAINREFLAEVGTTLAFAVDNALLVEQMRASEDLYASVVENAQDLIYRLARSGRFVFVNQAVASLLGRPTDAVLGRRWLEFVADADARRELFTELQRGRVDDLSFELPLLTRGGRKVMTSHRAHAIRDDTGTVRGIQGIAQDTTRERQAERAMRLHQDLVEALDDFVFMAEASGRLLAMNRKARQQLGWDVEQVSDMTLWDLHPSEDRSIAERERWLTIESGARTVEIRMLTASGELIPVRGRVTYSPESGTLQGVFRDLREEQMVNEHLLQVERLRALGEMASGVAHTFNNLLAIVGTTVQVAERLTDDERIRTELSAIRQAVYDGASTVRRLQDFARKRPSAEREPIDLTALLEGVVLAARRRIGDAAGPELSAELAPELACRGVEAELRDVFLNLLFNALDATPTDGRIEVRGRLQDAHLEVAVADTGRGMSADLQTRVFTPFFSTKGERGSGLGLAIARNVVTQHGGSIELKSEPGAGTTVTVRLPTTAAPATAARRPRRVLLAETEPLLRMQLSREIAKEGHVVESADSGPDALAKLQDEPFDCVFVDVAIPLTPQARQVIDLAKARGARVIVLLGWGDEITEDALRAHDIDGVLRKPFPPASILSLIAGCET